jgi:hypothetical protein
MPFNYIPVGSFRLIKVHFSTLLKSGMNYQVTDNAEAHKSSSSIGAKLFIVDQPQGAELDS